MGTVGGKAKSRSFVVGWDEVGTFGEAVINNEDRIVAKAFRKVGDEVGSNAFPRGVRNGDGDKFSWRGLWEGFGSRAKVTPSHVFRDKSVHSGPPVVARDQILSTPMTRMASDSRVMVEFDDFELKGSFFEDVDFSSIENQSVFF